MAEREVDIQNITCLYCSASIGRTWVSKDLYRCRLALLELGLKRIPTAKDVREQAKEMGLEKFDADRIPSGCPNGYHSPDYLPLR